jgi:AsmA protein
MKKSAKIILWGLAGLAVLLAAGAAILAATFDPNRYKPEIERLAREQTGRTLKLGGNLQLAFFPSVGARVAKLSLSERASGEEFVSLESAHASVKLLPLLRGDVVVDALRITGLKAQVIKGKDGKFNFDDLFGGSGEKERATKPAAKPAPATGGGVPLEFAISGVRVERSSVTYRDLSAGSEFVLSDFRLSTGRIAEQAQGKLQLGAALKGTKPQVDGRLDLNSEYRLDLAKKALAAPRLSVELAMASPDLPMKTIKLAITGSLQADLEKQTMSADLATKYDESAIQAKLGLAGFTPARYRFDINVDQLNVDRYLPKESAQPAPAAQPAAEKETDTPIDLSFLKDLNASGKLQIGALQVRGLKLANVRADVKAANGRMDVAPHSASLYEGAVAGELTLQADGNRIALKETLSGIAIGPLLRDTAKTDRLEGKGDLALDVTGSGKTVGAMKKTLAGTAKVNLKDGALKGIDIAAALRKTDLSLRRRPASAERTDFSELSASFAIKDGVARNEDLDLKSPLVKAGGRGAIDIGNSRLDYSFKAALVGTSKVTVPVRVSGPFAEPDYEINYGAVAADMAKTKVGSRVRDVRDGLKSLLGR